MSQDMNRLTGNGRNYLSSAPGRPKASGLRSYLGQRLASAAGYSTQSPTNDSRGAPEPAEKQGWKAWAGEKARGWKGGSSSEALSDSVERIRLFPGWATRRYSKEDTEDGSPRPFEVEAFVSGYAVAFKNRETMSRSQRAFIRVAKGFAALPKLASDTSLAVVAPEKPAPLSKSTEELLTHVHLPPRPDQVADAYDVDTLDRRFRRTRTSASDVSSLSSMSSTEDVASALKEAERRTGEMTTPPTSPLSTLSTESLRKMHANLETRLEPFWSSVLPNRIVRLKLYATAHQDPTTPSSESGGELKPLASIDVQTGIDGSFQGRFVVKWDELCHHPSTLHIAFGETVQEHDLEIRAELLKPQPIPGTTSYAQYQSPRRMQQNADEVTHSTKVKISITHSPIRVISDIDDTVKQSGVPNGARAVFHNVFVKELNDCIVDGMGEWYNRMWERGVRFHYVSNGPFELISILDEFFALSKLPVGSVKLRSFAGRSLFSGLFSAPADKKRAGVEDIIKSFPDSQFFLIGDSGEQDLELYAQVAKSYPDNVLGVFIRDVTTIKGVTDPLGDPTGQKALEVQASVASQYGGGDGASVASSGTDLSRSGSKRSMRSRTINSLKRGASSFSVTSIRTDSGQKGTKNELTDGVYFSSNPTLMTTEPESIADPSEDITTPTAEGQNTMVSLATATAGLNEGSPFGQATLKANNPFSSGTLNSSHRPNPKPIITEAPKPTPPPSMQQRPTPSRTSSRAQRQGTASSSASESDSTLDFDERFATRMSSIGSTSSSNSGFTPGALMSQLTLSTSGVSPEEKKRRELQMRVWRARLVMPVHVKLRLFKDPKECQYETDEMLQREFGS